MLQSPNCVCGVIQKLGKHYLLSDHGLGRRGTLIYIYSPWVELLHDELCEGSCKGELED
jgi:hypothetical protein